MFGRVRAASSTLDSLEVERAPPKVIKEDSYSIYEATLMKLKVGSQRNLEMEMGTESGCASADVRKSCGDALSDDQMMMDNDCSSASVSMKQRESRSVSVVYLFSKYKAKEEVITTQNHASSLTVSLSPTCSECECQSLRSNTGWELEVKPIKQSI